MTGPKKGDISDFAMQYKYVVFIVTLSLNTFKIQFQYE